MKNLSMIYINILIMLTALLIIRCESREKYYRPNLPEKLCTVGVIDADDTSDYEALPMPFDTRTSARFISFEKSYQSEYPGEINDSLRGLSFTIYSPEKEIFSFQCDSTIKNLKGFRIPSNIEFRTGERYFLQANEESLPEISAEVSVPELPSVPELISYRNLTINLTVPTRCVGYTTAKSSVVDFSFENNIDKELYYAVLLEGTGTNFSSTWPVRKSQVEFNVLEANTEGFFAILPGFTMYQIICIHSRNYDQTPFIRVPVSAYFIEGSNLPGNKCTLKISTQFRDERSPFEYIESLRVRLLSIPKELFLFEKSLYTYGRISSDPFAEPVYLNGNIKGGNGIFAVCRSSELSVIFPMWF